MSERVRVLHLTPNFSSERFGAGGGGEWVTAHLLRNLDASRYEVAVVSMFDRVGESPIERSLEERGIPVAGLGKRSGPDLRMFARLYRAVRAFRPHVLHTHRYILRYALPAVLRSRAAAHVHTVHGPAEEEVERFARWTYRLAYRRGTVPVAVAAEVLRSVRRLYGAGRGVLIPNGIPVEVYGGDSAVRAARRARWRARHGFAEGDVLFTCVARLTDVKNHAMLLGAFDRGLGGEPNARLVLVGTGELEAALRDEAARLGLAGRVHLLGQRGDVPEVLAASDAFVLASRAEGTPLSVLEAMAAGLPVAATAVGGLPELVSDGETGLLAPPGETRALAVALRRLYASPASRRAMGERAARRAHRRFSASAMARSYEALYERLLERTPVAA